MNVYSSLHAGINPVQGFIVPYGITIRVYGIPGLVTTLTSVCYTFDSPYIEYHSGDFVYDLDYEGELMYDEIQKLKKFDKISYIEHIFFQGLFLETKLIRDRQKTLEDNIKYIPLQDRYFMFKGKSDIEIQNEPIFGGEYKLSKLCYDLKNKFLPKEKDIILHSVSCMSLEYDNKICNKVRNLLLDIYPHSDNTSRLNELYYVKELLILMFSGLNSILNDEKIKGSIIIRILPSYEIKIELKKGIVPEKPFEKIIKFFQENKVNLDMSLYYIELYDKLGNYLQLTSSDGCKLVITSFDITDKIIKLLDNDEFSYLDKVKVKGETRRVVRKDGNRVSVRYDDSFKKHSDRKLIGLLNGLLSKIDPKYNYVVQYIKIITEYNSKTDVVVIPYEFLCMILELTNEKHNLEEMLSEMNKIFENQDPNLNKKFLDKYIPKE